MDKPDKILICRTDRIGDFILSIPFAWELRNRFPQAKIYWLISPINRPFMDLIEPNDGYFVYDKRQLKSVKALLLFARQLRKQKFDLAIALNPNLRLHILLFLSGIPKRFGWKVKGGGLFLNRTLEHTKPLGQMHEAQYNMLFLPFLGINKWSRPVPILKPVNARKGKAVMVAVHMGASCPSKRWPLQRFAEVIKGLLRRKLEVVLIGGPDEKKSAEEVLSKLGDDARILNKTGVSLSETIEILSQCDIIVSNDSGPVHIAAALGLGVVVIFGRNDPGLSPQRWGPLSNNKFVLHKAQCEVCLAHRCKKGFECLKNITVDDVLDAFDTVYVSAALKRRFS